MGAKRVMCQQRECTGPAEDPLGAEDLTVPGGYYVH